MATTHDNKNRTPLLMPHVLLGVDGFGMYHHFDARAERVHVVDPDGDRTHTEDLHGRPVEDWMAYVGDMRGWTRKEYGVGLDQILARALEGST